MTHWGMVVDLGRCVGCQTCTIACKMENGLPPDTMWRTVLDLESGVFPDVNRAFFPLTCMQCADPPCYDACPTTATRVREDGIVWIADDICIGCAYCVWACPYDARFINPATGKADKCTYCVHRLAEGLEEPACVRNCIANARYFGDLNDSNSEVSKLLSGNETRVLREEFGTKPNTYYIMDGRTKLLDISGVDER